MHRGFIKLHRRISDNPMWTLEPFTKGQAWVDLIMIANHKDGEINVRGNILIVKRGQVGWSELGLSKRWQWSRSKVRAFIKYLEKRQQIEQQKNTISSIISITNYEEYQEKNSKKDSTETTERQQKDTNKNVKNEKEKKNKIDYGEFKNVYLATDEYEKLTDKLGEIGVDDYIQRLDNYIEQQGKDKYKSHYATINNWYNKDGKPQIKKQSGIMSGLSPEQLKSIEKMRSE